MQSKNLKYILGITFGIGLCIIGLLYANYRTESIDVFKSNLTGSTDNDEVYTETSTEQTTIIVYITGEVNKPDVYSLSEDARLVDLVEEAGGFTDKAYIDDLNLAQVLKDGEKFVVQNKDNVSDDVTHNVTDTQEEEAGLININTADMDALDSLPGIGEKIAGSIISYREKNGDFTSIDEIKEVEGIGDGIYEDIKDSITIE